MLAAARTPPITFDPREGVWLGVGELYVYQSKDRWSVFPGQAAVNKLATDGSLIWLATDDGVIRLDTGSRRATRLGMEDGLPSQSVTSVAVDDNFVWFATNKGVARYRKLDRTIRVYTEAEGLPHRAVNDVTAVGRVVWLGTRQGLAVYDPDTDGFRGYTARDGLAGENVAEILPVGDDVWCRTDHGLSRLRVKARHFANFGWDEIGGSDLRVFVQDGDRIWLGTENGLSSFEPTSDTILPFEQQAALEGKSIVGVEPFTDYLFIATDKEIVQYHKTRRTIRRFTEADGLARRTGGRGTVLSGNELVFLFPDGAEIYDIQRDLWTSHTLAVTEGGKQGSGYRLWSRFDSSEPYDLRTHRFSDQRYATAQGGAGLGHAWENGRSLDAQGYLDYGQLEMRGVRDFDAGLQYLGNEKDLVREFIAGSAIGYRTLEEGLERPFPLMGGHLRVASPGQEPALQATADAGQRRGLSARDFVTGPVKEIYPLSHRYIMPGSERVTVDGQPLINGTDYTIIYTAGQLAFLDPELVDPLSIIAVDYEYDLLPKKGLGVLSILDFLPADDEVGAWARSSDPRLISEESGLYAQIDGAAPKYINRGWVRSVYAEYRQGSRSLQVAVHDMGTDTQAANIFNFDLPPAREAVNGDNNVVIDIGLANSYAVKAVSKNYYFELSIDEKSDAAKQSVKLFVLQILDRAQNAGENHVPGPRPTFAAARVAASPVSGMELGARALEQTAGPPGTGAPGTGWPGVRSAGLDARAERPVGAGRFTAYGEALGTEGTEPGSPHGMGAMARLRLSHPLLEGTATGRWLSPGYIPLTSSRTLYGTLESEGQVQATAYPARWLPATVFFLRQKSDGDGGGHGTVQYALGRLQLNGERLPATSVQVGQTLLASPAGTDTGRVRVVAQTEYDLAQGPLAFLRMRRFALRALYGISDADTRQGSTLIRSDRAEQMRFEGRLAPTANETGYALFRSRGSTFRLAGAGWATGTRHWELNAGARSDRVPGLIPQLLYAAIYDDDRITNPTTVRAAKGSMGAELSVFPGQWWSPLTPVLLDTRYSISADDRTEGELRTLHQRVHRIDNRFVYAGAGKLELEFYQILEFPYAGPDEATSGRRLELGNRIVVRPVFVSPITLWADYAEQKKPNDPVVAPGAPPFAFQKNYETSLEWLMRWTRSVTSRVKGSYSRGESRDTPATDPVTHAVSVSTFTQQRAGPELELRFLVAGQEGSLYLVPRGDVYRLFGQGSAAVVGAGFDVSLGAIWTLGDDVYLDSEVAYHRLNCFGGPCLPVSTLAPRMLLSGKL